MKKLILAAALVLGAGAQANSVVDVSSPISVDPITEKLTGLGLTVTSIESSPITGLKTVLTNQGVFYTSADGKYLLQGSLIDIENRVNLTENALNGVRKEGIAKHADSMIVYKAEEEKYQVSIFTDITCGYCRKLHRELEDYLDAGITVRYLAFPRGGLRGNGYEDLKNVWCADDAASAMTEAKAGNAVAKVENCSAPVDVHYQLGQSFGVSGTPAIVLGDGTMIPGYQPAAQLAKILEQQSKKS